MISMGPVEVYQFGTLRATYRVNWSFLGFFVVLLIAALSFIELLIVQMYGYSSNVLHLSIGATLVLGVLASILLYSVLRKWRVLVCSEGLIRIWWGKTELIRWDAIESVWQQVTQHDHHTTRRYIMHCVNGSNCRCSDLPS